MRTFAKLFGKSPFDPLRTHMDKVVRCIDMVPGLFEAVERGDQEELLKRAAKLSKAEHDADLVKNDIRGSLKSSLFLPVDRASLLEVLSIQDSLADKAEDVGVLLSFKPLPMIPRLAEPFHPFLAKNIEAFHKVSEVIHALHELMESTFGGGEAEKIRSLVGEVAYLEHQVDLQGRELTKALFESEEELSYTTFYLWNRVIEEVGALSNASEKLANRILLTMEMS